MRCRCVVLRSNSYLVFLCDAKNKQSYFRLLSKIVQVVLRLKFGRVCVCFLACIRLLCVLNGYLGIAHALPPFDNLHRCFIVPDRCPNDNVTFYLYTRYGRHINRKPCIDNGSEALDPPPPFLRQLSNQPHRLDVGNVATIQSAPLAVNRPIVVLLHGYTGHRDFSPNTEIRPGNWFSDSTISSRSLESTKIQAYLRDGDYNVISVDYRPLAPEPCYLQAVQNLPTVARCTAQLLDTLVERRRIALADIHVIGFSLGAQAAGMISNYVRSGRLQRITGGWWG